jgi:hypothetical protein
MIRQPSLARRASIRPGFTLVEAMTALALTALAGSALLLAVDSSMRTSTASVEQTVALGMAQQLIDECLGARHHAADVTPFQTPLGPNAWELGGAGRERFDDTDDFHGFVATSAEGVFGEPLGTGDDAGGARPAAFQVRPGQFTSWKQSVEVYYVNPDDFRVRLPAGQTSVYRAVEVVISRTLPGGATRELARLRKVYAYIPSAQ